MDRPAILITPLHDAVEPDAINALSKALFEAQPGQVLAVPFPVQIYHQCDGYWIESQDLGQSLGSSPVPTTQGDEL